MMISQSKKQDSTGAVHRGHDSEALEPYTGAERRDGDNFFWLRNYDKGLIEITHHYTGDDYSIFAHTGGKISITNNGSFLELDAPAIASGFDAIAKDLLKGSFTQEEASKLNTACKSLMNAAKDHRITDIEAQSLCAAFADIRKEASKER